MSIATHASCARRYVTQLLVIMVLHRCELLKFSLLRCRRFFLSNPPVLLAYRKVSLWLEFNHSAAEVILVTASVLYVSHLKGMAYCARDRTQVLLGHLLLRLRRCTSERMQHVLNAGVAAHGDVLLVVCLSGHHDDLGWRVVDFAILR